MKEIEIDVEGRALTAVLMEKEAPKTCEIVSRMLPVSGEVVHARWSGDAVYLILTPARTEEVIPVEGIMGRVYGARGDVLVFDGRNPESVPGHLNYQEFFIVYGLAQFRFRRGDEVCNLFARIKEDQLEELGKIAEEIWKKGWKKITIRPKR